MDGAPPDVEAAIAKDDLLSALHLLHLHIAAAKVITDQISLLALSSLKLHGKQCATRPYC